MPIRLRIAVVALLSTLALLTAPSAQACACGGFAAADGESVAASAEYAVLSYDGTTERVLLSMNTLSAASDAALLIPTPRPATAALAEPTVFAELERLTAPETIVRYRWWPETSRGDYAAAPPGSGGGPPVSVLQTRQLGPLEVTSLAAGDAGALTDWLDAHGYVLRTDLAEALTPYVSEGWYYTAIRLATDGDDLSGALQPLDLRFQAGQLVYPMRLSAAATTSQFVRTYVFADHRMQRSDPTADSGTTDLRFAGRISLSAVRTASLSSIVAERPYLTAIEQYFGNPGQQIVSDFTFEPAPSDQPYRRTVYRTELRTILGLPAGPVLVVLGIVAANLVVGAWLLRRRGRGVGS